MNEDDIDIKIQAQNYAIVESVRFDLPEIEHIQRLRKSQVDDVIDTTLKRKLLSYIQLLDFVLKTISEILDHVK